MIDDEIILVVVLFLIIDTLIIGAVLMYFSRIITKLTSSGDFGELYHTWPAEHRSAGRVFHRQYLAINGIWYSNTATLIVGDKGLHISFAFPISLSISQAAYIPWDKIRFFKTSRAFWTDVYEYQVAGKHQIIITVMKQVAFAFPESLKPV